MEGGDRVRERQLAAILRRGGKIDSDNRVWFAVFGTSKDGLPLKTYYTHTSREKEASLHARQYVEILH